ncbi:Os03g0425450, partial [Oryza sativa Japonica Group]
MQLVGHLGEAIALADVHQVEDVFLEAGATESHAGVEKLGADPGVLAHGVGDLGDVGAGGLAERGHGVDGRDPLGQERVGGELGQLGGPEVGGEDPLLGDPSGVHVLERLDGGAPRGGLAAADEDAVGGEQVADGGALGEELRVGEDLEADAVAAVVVEDLLDGLRGLDRHGGLLDDDLVGRRHGGDHPRRALPVGEVGGLAGAEAAGLGGGVHGDEDDVGLADVPLDVAAEEEVPPAAAAHDVVEARLVDRERVAVPGVDAGGGDVDDDHLDVGALEGDDRHGRAADIAGSEAADLHHL